MSFPFSSVYNKLACKLIFALVFCSMSSCNDDSGLPYNTKSVLKECINTAQTLCTQNSAAAIVLCDSLLTDSKGQPLNKRVLLKLLSIKQYAFSNLKQMDSVVVMGERIRETATAVNDSLAMAESLIPVKGDIDFTAQQKMEVYLPGAISTFGKLKKEKEKAALCASYGAILCHKGDFNKAQSFLLEAHKIFEASGDLKALITVCTNIGTAYSRVNSIKEAFAYYGKALGIGQKLNDSMRQVSVLMNIGTMYEKKPDSSLIYYQKAISLLPSGSNYYIKMMIDFNVAVAYTTQKKFVEAEKVFKEMLVNCNKYQQLEGVAMAHKGLAELYLQTERYQLTKENIIKAISLAEKLGMDYELLSMNAKLIQSYKGLGDYKGAMMVSEKCNRLKDSLLSADKQVAVHELEMKYQTEKKELENSNLKQRLSTRKTIIIILLVSAVVLLILLRQRSRLYKERDRSYAILMEQYRNERANRISEFKAPHLTILTNTKADVTINEGEESLIDKLITFYTIEKPYLNSKLKIEEVAQYLNCTQKELSFIIKQSTDLNFTGFTNRYRVGEAKRMFENAEYLHIKMLTIAEKSGFGTLQSFYNAFELYTGVKPAFFRSRIVQAK